MNCVAVNNKGVVFEVFTGLDIVLILIRPVQLHFLALIGDGIDAFLIATFGNEVSVFVVTAKKGVQRRINICLQCGKVCTFRQLFLELYIFLLHRRSVRQHIYSHAHGGNAFLNLRHLGADFLLTTLCEGSKSFLNHLRQTLRQKFFNLCFAEVHNAIDTKIKI